VIRPVQGRPLSVLVCLVPTIYVPPEGGALDCNFYDARSNDELQSTAAGQVVSNKGFNLVLFVKKHTSLQIMALLLLAWNFTCLSPGFSFCV